MKAMILAAGRGERMRPLTDTCPKPLLKVAGKPLIEHHINKLAEQGIKDIVINYAWLGEQIVAYLGDGKRYGVNIKYSPELNGALETGGGLIKALPMLTGKNGEPFLLVNGDVFSTFDFSSLPKLGSDKLAHIWLVKNPEHNKTGDFIFEQDKLANISTDGNNNVFTFSGISLFRPEFFQQKQVDSSIKLGPMIKAAINKNQVSATVLENMWVDVGTPERLSRLNDHLNDLFDKSLTDNR
jgi:MurNAc alpha-1-phosphate uridylyltransferase